MPNYLYVAPNLADTALISSDLLEATTERHNATLAVGPLKTLVNPRREVDLHGPIGGVVVEMERGWPGAAHLRFARFILGRKLRVWFYWPHEQAVECVDRERLRSYWRLWSIIVAHRTKHAVGRALGQKPDHVPALAASIYKSLLDLIDNARPVPFDFKGIPSVGNPIPGSAAYFRFDFWTDIGTGGLKSGGSYGHTCYVAKELHALTDNLICFLPSRYSLLDEFGVHQVVIDPPHPYCNDESMLEASWYYIKTLTPVLRAMRPAYIYERHCIGNFAGAALSQQLGIPYMLEYNGSEISMNRSFGREVYRFEDVFLLAEEAAFRQATVITVVSQAIKDSLVARSVDPAKILVNPNGADPEAYQPAPGAVKRTIRQEFGWGDDERVIGFTGTFGGWHGIDVLAAAMPEICARDPNVRFLLIGDGAYKHLVDKAVADGNLGERVVMVGRVPQKEGARLLGACDIYVSPHSSHMVDSKFFGSPTKLFEYMSMGGGIVSSDLEQLGEVLSPALRVSDFATRTPAVTDQRAILCAPGDAREFIEAVLALAGHPATSDALGANARHAVFDHYSWQRHVERHWRFVQGEAAGDDPADAVRNVALSTRISTGDEYKEQTQNQWNQNPVGVHYAKLTRVGSLEWYREIERHRYQTYACWMPELMEFQDHKGHDVLEIGGGVGTDLSQFAANGARVTDLDLSAGHLELARRNFAARGLEGRFLHHDAESLPFPDDSFDLVYSNGVLHHTPNTDQVVAEIKRVLRPGGRVIVMMYAEVSWHYLEAQVWTLGLDKERLKTLSIGDIMSRYVEKTATESRPLVKVYSARRLRAMFEGFDDRQLFKRQLVRDELPYRLRPWIPMKWAEHLLGWNLIIKARKPARA